MQLDRLKPLNGYEICKIVKGALTRGLRASYDAIADSEFECDPKNLIKDLEKAHELRASKRSEMKTLIQKTLAQEISGEYRIPQKNGGANKNKNKDKSGGRGAAGGDKPPGRPSQKECDRCKKWKPGNLAYKTHNSGQCRVFNADGTRKDNGFSQREEGEVPNNYRKRYQNRISNGGKDDTQMDREYRALNKKYKKYKKRARKYANRKRSRNNRRYESSSDSSDSYSSMSE